MPLEASPVKANRGFLNPCRPMNLSRYYTAFGDRIFLPISLPNSEKRRSQTMKSENLHWVCSAKTHTALNAGNTAV